MIVKCIKYHLRPRSRATNRRRLRVSPPRCTELDLIDGGARPCRAIRPRHALHQREGREGALAPRRGRRLLRASERLERECCLRRRGLDALGTRCHLLTRTVHLGEKLVGEPDSPLSHLCPNDMPNDQNILGRGWRVLGQGNPATVPATPSVVCRCLSGVTFFGYGRSQRVRRAPKALGEVAL